MYVWRFIYKGLGLFCCDKGGGVLKGGGGGVRILTHNRIQGQTRQAKFLSGLSRWPVLRHYAVSWYLWASLYACIWYVEPRRCLLNGGRHRCAMCRWPCSPRGQPTLVADSDHRRWKMPNNTSTESRAPPGSGVIRWHRYSLKAASAEELQRQNLPLRQSCP